MASRRWAMMVFQIQMTKRWGILPIFRDYIAYEEAHLRGIECYLRVPVSLAGK